jgi:polyribonucleotide nucleotidyltransferase
MADQEPKTFTTDYAGQTLTVETGHIAEQANGALFIRCRDTVVLVTAVASKAPRGEAVRRRAHPGQLPPP